MQLSAEQLSSHLKQPLAPFYIVYGEEPLLVQKTVEAIRIAAKQQAFDEREVLLVEPGFDWQRIQASKQNLSFFSQKKLIELHVPSGKLTTEGALALQNSAAALTNDIVTLVIFPKLERQVLNSKWFQAIAEIGVVIPLKTLTGTILKTWIKTELAQQDQFLTEEALHFLAERVEGNLVAANQEIQKLGLAFSEGKLSLQEVKEAVLDGARYDISQLSEAILQADKARIVKIMTGLNAAAEAPTLVLWAITQEIRLLIKIRQALREKQPMQAVMQKLRVWGNRQSLVTQAAKRLKTQALYQSLLQAGQIDRLIKGLAKGNSWDELLQLALALA